jgi:hypothetical protein
MLQSMLYMYSIFVWNGSKFHFTPFLIFPFKSEMSHAKRVRFTREVNEEEEYVVKRLSHHVTRCSRCKDSYWLCQRGTSLLQDVQSYLYLDERRIFSWVDQREIIFPWSHQVVLDVLGRSLAPTKPLPLQTPHSYIYHINKAPSEYNVDVRPVKARKESRSTMRSLPCKSCLKHPKVEPPDEKGDTVLIYAWLPAMRIPLRLRKADLRSAL